MAPCTNVEPERSKLAWIETAYGSKEFFAALHHVEIMYNTIIYTLH